MMQIRKIQGYNIDSMGLMTLSACSLIQDTTLQVHWLLMIFKCAQGLPGEPLLSRATPQNCGAIK